MLRLPARTLATLLLLVMLLAAATCARRIVPINVNPLLVPDSLAMLSVGSVPDSPNHVPPLDSTCHLEGPVVLEATQWQGYVGFRPTAGLWYISYVYPLRPGEMTDSEYLGFVCDLPDAFKKQGLKVQFSGRYYHAWKYIAREYAGETVLYLSLTALQKE